jgi:hypothetical protein
MADTDAMRKDFEQWKQENGVVGGGTLLDRIYFAGWQKGQSRALASRPAEVDDEALRLLRTILAGDVGQQTLGKLARGQSTETEDGKAWLAAHKLITAPSHTTNKDGA